MLLCMLLCCGHAAAGKLYEWIDRDGTTHFSDQAPLAIPYTEKKVRPASGSASSGKTSGIRAAERRLLEKIELRQTKLKQSRQAAVTEYEKHRKRCRQAQARYRDTARLPRSAGGGKYKSLLNAMNQTCD